MKLVPVVLFLALAAVACSSSSSNNSSPDLPIITGDVGGDVDTLTNTDTGRETATDTNPVADVKADEGTVPIDPGPDHTVVPDTTDPGPVADVLPEVPAEGTTEIPPVEVTEVIAVASNSCEYMYDTCYPTCSGLGSTEQTQCQQNCQAALSPAESTIAQNLSTCVSNAQAACQTATDQNACLDQKCSDQISQCFQGPTYQTCADLFNCIDDCLAGWDGTSALTTAQQDCVSDSGTGCLENSTYQAQSDRNAFYDCEDTACPSCTTTPPGADCNTCFDSAQSDPSKCEPKLLACVTTGTTYTTCGDLMVCLNACSDTDTTCSQTCFNNSTKDTLSTFDARSFCIQTNCPDCAATNPTATQTANCNTCYATVSTDATKCLSQVQACEKTGTSTCAQMQTCLNNCATGDATCQSTCIYAGTATAQNLFDAMETCLSTQCPDASTFSTCANAAVQDATKCENQYNACTNG
jgi:hypothetical protein